jgi:UDP-glucose 4-epimerase
LDWVDVKRIAEIVCEEMGLRDVAFRFTGGVDGGRGWRGDVKTMLLSVDKLLNIGWKPTLGGEGAVRLSCRELLRSIDVC